jgi:phosphate acetyltransferase
MPNIDDPVSAEVSGFAWHGTMPPPAPDLQGAPNLAATLVERCDRRQTPRAGVVFPVDALALAGALQAHRAGVIDARLIGPRAQMREIAACARLPVDDLLVTDVPDEGSALAAAAEAVRGGRVDLLVKGSGHSGSLLHSVLECRGATHEDRRASHIFAMAVPRWPRLVFVTDAVLNIAPDLSDKADICRNAIDLAHLLGLDEPKVAVLSAAEDVEASMPPTLHAAALAQMGHRGQLGRAIVDGPLALDDALDEAALALKGIDSPVGGQADVLVVPSIEAGNILYKGLVVMAGAVGAGLVVHTPVPVVLASRSDSVATRVASAALGAIWVGRTGPSRRAGG